MLKELQFKYLSNRYADDIYRFALALLGSHADAEDAAQEVLIKLWTRLPVMTAGKMKTWMLTTTRHHCLDQLRKRKRNEEVSIEFQPEISELEQAGPQAPGSVTDQEAVHREIMTALQRLPENQQSTFVLYEINGLKYQEIARTLNIPINSVKVYISRARQNLQKHLKKESSWIKSYINGFE